MKHFLHILSAVALFFAACASSEKKPEGFATPTDIKADSVAINEIILPREMYCTDDYLLIKGKTKDSLVYVYKMPEIKYLYSGLKVGEGPGEFSNEWVNFNTSNSSNGDVAVIDWSRDAINYYSLNDNEISLKHIIKTDPEKRTDEDIFHMTDSLYVDNIFVDKNLFNVLINLNTGKVLDSIPSYGVQKTIDGEGYTMSMGFNYPDAVIIGSRCALVSSETSRVDIFDISKGKFDLVASVGDQRTVEEINKVDFLSLKDRINNSAVCNDKYIYVLRNTTKKLDSGLNNTETVASDILVYDWKGNEMKMFHLDRIINDIVVHDNKIYGYNARNDFEYLYIYDLGL